jgi:hypothetical protein
MHQFSGNQKIIKKTQTKNKKYTNQKTNHNKNTK